MKKIFLCVVIALFSATAFGSIPTDAAADAGAVYAQKKGENKGKEKKDPPGPPIVKDKGQPKPPKDKPKDRKRPD
ncbi:MAG TPA: hypothetical protein VF131_19975 [Blastocatellia bacterium]|nr:hypothetical protein [Blastocatellia bacterium]